MTTKLYIYHILDENQDSMWRVTFETPDDIRHRNNEDGGQAEWLEMCALSPDDMHAEVRETEFLHHEQYPDDELELVHLNYDVAHEDFVDPLTEKQL